MDKLTMAQDYIIAEVRRVGICSIDEDKIMDAWKVADAMQAEAEKREDKTRPEVLRTENSPQLDIHGLLHSLDEYFDQAECTKTDRMANNLLAEIYEKLSGEVNSVREWQPDWSQAPEWAKWWAMDADSDCYWFGNKPAMQSVTWIPNDPTQVNETQPFNYQGNWKESLRKRPQ